MNHILDPFGIDELVAVSAIQFEYIEPQLDNTTVSSIQYITVNTINTINTIILCPRVHCKYNATIL